MAPERELRELIAKWRDEAKHISIQPSGSVQIRRNTLYDCADELEKLLAAVPAPAELGPMNSKGYWSECTNPNHGDSQEGPCERNWILDAPAPTPAPPLEHLPVIYSIERATMKGFNGPITICCTGCDWKETETDDIPFTEVWRRHLLSLVPTPPAEPVVPERKPRKIDMSTVTVQSGYPFKCKARSANMGANDPQDCDWPMCGCDEYADKVIAALQECGALAAAPRAAGGQRPQNVDKYLTIALNIVESWGKEIGQSPVKTGTLVERIAQALAKEAALADLNVAANEYAAVAEPQVEERGKT